MTLTPERPTVASSESLRGETGDYVIALVNRASTGRRGFVAGLAAIGGAAAVGCSSREDRAHGQAPRGARRERSRGEEHEALITPGEDLMREHGVLERVLVVWHEAEGPLRRGEPIDVDALRGSVELVQRFIERYHERLEEDFVFPRLEQAGQVRELVRTLRDQHEVGRSITAELVRRLGGSLDEPSRAQVADRLAAYARMYLAHASREDTIVFPAFRELAGAAYAELGEQFEEREHEILGEGGFRAAVAEVERVERAFGLDDLSRLTPERSPA